MITGRLPWQPAGIKFTQCVSGQKSAFSPLQEKLCVGSKNDPHRLELSRVLYQHAKFGGDRTTRAGCGNENWCFFVCHACSACAWGHSSNKYCVTIYGSILMRFSAFFGLFFQTHYTVLIFVARWRHNFPEIAVKIAKSPKIGEVCAHHFVQIAERFEETSTAVV